jgi:hypothetical protein
VRLGELDRILAEPPGEAFDKRSQQHLLPGDLIERAGRARALAELRKASLMPCRALRHVV